MKKKDLLAIYLNEFNNDYLYKGAKKYKCHLILKNLKLKNIETFTRDKKQNYNLDPWVQAVSISTGKSSKIHKIYNLGQPVKKIIQIWDLLCRKKISTSVWGAMNSKMKNSKYLNFYFPDPWNFKDKSKPTKLKNLYLLPNYYAKNYLKFNYVKFIFLAFLFTISLIKNSKLSDFLSDVIFSFKIILAKGFKNYILFFLFDIFFMNVVVHSLRKERSRFNLIFLNSIAHYQHNNWNEKENEEVFFLCVERLFKKIERIKREYSSFILFNGFTQKKIRNEYIFRPKNPKKFLSKFIKFKSLEQDMTNGGYIFFNNKTEMEKSYKILSNLLCLKKNIFFTEKFNDKTIFYKINIKSKRILNLNSKASDLIEIKNNFKLNKNNKINITQFFIENIKFIKTTGVHIPQGSLLFDNLKSLKSINRTENHLIFNHICKHFNI